MPARLRALLLALVAALTLSGTGVAHAHPGHGVLVNNDDVYAVYVSYTYAGNTYTRYIAPGDVSNHSYDVNAFHVPSCYKVTVKWWDNIAYAWDYTYTYTGVGWFSIGNDRTAYVTNRWKYC